MGIRWGDLALEAVSLESCHLGLTNSLARRSELQQLQRHIRNRRGNRDNRLRNLHPQTHLELSHRQDAFEMADVLAVFPDVIRAVDQHGTRCRKSYPL